MAPGGPRRDVEAEHDLDSDGRGQEPCDAVPIPAAREAYSEEWVEIPNDGHPYYWSRRTHETAWNLPMGCPPTAWVSEQCGSRVYFWHRGTGDKQNTGEEE